MAVMKVLPVQAVRVKAPAMMDKAKVCRAQKVEAVQGMKVRETQIREMRAREMSRVRAAAAGVAAVVWAAAPEEAAGRTRYRPGFRTVAMMTSSHGSCVRRR